MTAFLVRLLCMPVIVAALLCSPVLLAEDQPDTNPDIGLDINQDINPDINPDISRYTTNRERTPGPAIPPPVEQKPDISDYTLHRERSFEPDTGVPPTIDVLDMEVIERGGRYQMKLVAVIRAPAPYVRHVLADFQHLYRLNPSIVESEVLGCDQHGFVMVRTQALGCAANFCEVLERVECVYLLRSGDIVADIIPELSQFRSGKSYWWIKPIGEHTIVGYRSYMEPEIVVPPVVGKFLVKKSIKQQMLITFTNLEKIARAHAARGLPRHSHFMDVCRTPEDKFNTYCVRGR